jgi:hypothetical protein
MLSHSLILAVSHLYLTQFATSYSCLHHLKIYVNGKISPASLATQPADTSGVAYIHVSVTGFVCDSRCNVTA